MAVGIKYLWEMEMDGGRNYQLGFFKVVGIKMLGFHGKPPIRACGVKVFAVTQQQDINNFSTTQKQIFENFVNYL